MDLDALKNSSLPTLKTFGFWGNNINVNWLQKTAANVSMRANQDLHYTFRFTSVIRN